MSFNARSTRRSTKSQHTGGTSWASESAPTDTEIAQERPSNLREPQLPSLSIHLEFSEFKRRNVYASNEEQVKSDVIPIILGREYMPSGQNHVFNDMEPIIPDVTTAKPDYYNGTVPEKIHTRIRRDLNKYIVPCTDTSRPAAPNFFGEVKGPDGSARVLMLQIKRDLDYGARAMHKLQSYGEMEPVYDRKAHTFGFTYHGGQGTAYLQLYATHLERPERIGERPKYCTSKVMGFDLDDNLDTYWRGVSELRNIKELAEEHRNEIILGANTIADLRVDEEAETESDNS
ncbi:hypothetical protein NA57DRAFT_59104 [Rhizodiscina lignyota]|uniref:Uncharacterized protein n=1 Tax=Rhizodiscina lignyota TaxID=1504668 RepID=A0A9P4IB75_9PEZI|nr:hypothetical protein NA57DRAFT_59104 [Rhizodiscina lignyota]